MCTLSELLQEVYRQMPGDSARILVRVDSLGVIFCFYASKLDRGETLIDTPYFARSLRTDRRGSPRWLQFSIWSIHERPFSCRVTKITSPLFPNVTSPCHKGFDLEIRCSYDD